MVKITVDKRRNATKAEIPNTKEDALKRISRRLALDPGIVPHKEKLFMNDSYEGNSVCCSEDEYSEVTGKKVASMKASKNHKLGFRKAVFRWQVAMIRDIIRVGNDTFYEALDKALADECLCSAHAYFNRKTNK